jgi:hypothetical protein
MLKFRLQEGAVRRRLANLREDNGPRSLRHFSILPLPPPQSRLRRILLLPPRMKRLKDPERDLLAELLTLKR